MLGELSKTESHPAPALGFMRQALCLAQSVLKLAILLPQPLKWRDLVSLPDLSLLFSTGKMRLLIFLLGLPPSWQTWGTPALLETVVPRETHYACELVCSLRGSRLQTPDRSSS